MTSPIRFDLANLTAIDVHAHMEPEAAQGTEADIAARKYFQDTGAPRDPDGLANYYRSRKIACVVFSVDERLTGRPQVPNETVADFAEQNADIAIAFASIDPTRGPEAVREARRLVASGRVHGLKLHPPLQQFFANDPIAYPLYEVFA
ncbi:MAG: amidohydrolase family protein, partial [Acidobacteriota bacterium]